MEELFISDEYYNNFEYGATFDCRMINWRKRNHLSRKEKCSSLVTAALLPSAGLNVNTPQCGVCMSWVLGPGPPCVVTHLPWTGSAPAGGWGQLPQTSDHPHTAVADWCRPTHTFSSCSRSRSCHVQPNLTRVPSCFKNATFMRSDWAEFCMRSRASR